MKAICGLSFLSPGIRDVTANNPRVSILRPAAGIRISGPYSMVDGGINLGLGLGGNGLCSGVFGYDASLISADGRKTLYRASSAGKKRALQQPSGS